MKLLLIGMPASGKSTYLGALSHVLTSGRKKTALRLLTLSDDEAHVATLESLWLTCQPPKRTQLRSNQQGSFEVTVGDDGKRAELLIPDLSGEAFRMCPARDLCPPGLFQMLADADGLVLFTNADRPSDDRLIFDAAPQYVALDAAFEAELAGDVAPDRATADGEIQAEEPAGTTRTDEVSDGEDPAERRFDPDAMPEEVLLVELLQQVNRAPLPRKHRKLAVVASAWDVVADADRVIAPPAWLDIHRPMLSQFFQFNRDAWTVNVWGISALGGSLPEHADRLLAVAEPTDRIMVVGDADGVHDLTAPLRWLMTDTTTAP
ncbi:hypothetical protein D3C72_345090 [compost metagenome]